MIVSCNELDAVVRKAFRGAGYHWGEAEEAGKAAIWLARNGLLPANLALGLLRSAGDRPGRLRPKPDLHDWAGSGVETCPLLAGIILADNAANMVGGKQIAFANLHAPGFVLPFLGQLALDRNMSFLLSLSGMSATVSSHGVDLRGPPEALASPSPAKLSPAGPIPRTANGYAAQRYSAEISSSDWDSLNEFAAKTYVAASEYSRVAGAGAGVADND